ncbi:piggyBac transposable element-derived protein 3-like [Teleopsis dalmanni]|uniref:piggyBac transposable element-derived protein 3-like n=1 Tax=Teleopsis dalmanni TaxID=139649 RepID=UPI0018CDA084|nr:piggyBac transposable element-derived protein 3-like [Teleopsis dalmanni]
MSKSCEGFGVRKFLHMADIKCILEGSDSENEAERDSVSNIVYIPPSPDALSDTEHINDEIVDGSEVDALQDVAGEIELHFINTKEDIAAPSLDLSKTEHNSPGKKPGFSKTSIPRSVWKKTKFPKFPPIAHNTTGLEAQQEDLVNIYGGKTPIELFKLFFDKEVVELIITESKKYASQNNVTTNILDERLLNRFIGFLLFSGYHKLPEIEHYWRQQNDFGIPIVKEALTRNEFRQVKRFLHIADNNSLDSNDRFAKVTPLIALLNKKFMQFGVFHEYLSIDEQMVPYFGRHSSKMYIRNKPIKFGFKLWVLASSDGYMYSTIPYAGSTQPYDKEIGLGAHVVLKLLENVEHPEWHCKNFLACGTVRRNRLPSNLSLKGKKELKKGESDYAFDKQNGIYVISWQDNSLVTIATNFESMEPMNSARRYNRTLQKYVNLPQPHAIANYNLHMGGVDMADNAISNYRISIRGKKWWWPLFSNAVDSCLVNAWKLHCFISKAQKNKQMSQLDFRSVVSTALLSFNYTEEQNIEQDNIAETQRPDGLPRATTVVATSAAVAATMLKSTTGRIQISRHTSARY